ncbi:hypothetical protein BGX28_007012 [Mortierella sp. GBA30]|nr:hypothetical protein BGX28_007012 [Mortierella sp. GBA30]
MVLLAPVQVQSIQTYKVDELAPSLMEPKHCLGSRTPMHLVHISNLKLNAQIFSSRSLSIHRRILIKNFLTLLYQQHPIEWIEQSPVDDKDHWLEQTLSAAGIGQSEIEVAYVILCVQLEERDYDYSGFGTNADYEYCDNNGNGDYDYTSPDIIGNGIHPVLSPAAAAAASAVTQRRKPLTLRSNRVPLPRPVSVDLPQSLNSYLSNVFDVDWSVGLASTEDSLYTAKTASPLHSRFSLAPSALASYSESSPSSLTPSTLASPNHQPIPAPSSSSAFSAISSSLASFARASGRKYASNSVEPESTADGGRRRPDRTQEPVTKHKGHRDLNSSGYGYGKSEITDNESSVDTLVVQHPPWQQNQGGFLVNEKQPLAQSSHVSQISSNSYTHHEPGQPPHIHNHIHIHVHNYPPESAQKTQSSRASSPPISRSSRYPKPEQQQQQLQRPVTPTGRRSPRMPATQVVARDQDADLKSKEYPALSSQSHIYRRYHDESPQAATILHSEMAGPYALQHLSSALPSSSAAVAYPPEKSSSAFLGSADEAHYLATAPPVSSRYHQSLPPPPYTQSLEDNLQPSSPLHPSPVSSLAYPRPMKQVQSPLLMHSAPIPAITAKPLTLAPSISSSGPSSTIPSASGQQKLIEYQQYLERQKMFARNDDSKAESRLHDGLNFMRLLSKPGSKKKTTVSMISAPLPMISPLDSFSTLSSPSSPPNTPSPPPPLGSPSAALLQDLVKQDLTIANPRHSKNAVSLFKGTLSSVKSGLTRSSTLPTSSSSAPSSPVNTAPTSVASLGTANLTMSTARITPPPQSHDQQLTVGPGPLQKHQPLYQRHHRKTPSGNIQGLILGLILQRLGVNYLILERACHYGIFAGTTVIGSFALNLFEMLGILDQIKSVSTEFHRMKIWTEQGTAQAEADFTGAQARYSHNGIVVSCRVLQDLLRSEIPAEKLVDNKDVVRYEQDLDEVRVFCRDESVYRGVILVGCDGHQSTIRRLLHEEQDLEISDGDRIPLRRTCDVIGATRLLHGSTLLDPDTLQNVFDLDYGNCQTILGQSTPYSCWMTPVPNEARISWMITYNRAQAGAHSIHGGDGLEPDSMDRTNLEQAFLDQLVPGGGQGILQVMLDAYSLAPLIKHALVVSGDATGETQLEQISIAFECYYRERHDIARNAVDASANLGRLFSQQPNQPGQPSQSFQFDFAFDFFPAWLQQYAERGNMHNNESDEDDGVDSDSRHPILMDKVIIVGGGLGGLLLAILLERASIDYVVLERSMVAKMPLEGGGVISMTSQIQPLLQQLGLLDTLRDLSKPLSRVTVLEVSQGSGKQPWISGAIDSVFSLSRYGYYSLAISRPELYNVLVERVPTEKFLLGKQVQEVRQDGDRARCVCVDGSSYQGIIIGADGAYSNVRLNLYRYLKDKDALAIQDRAPMRYEYQALVGMTKPLDHERFKFVTKEHSDARVLVSQGQRPFTSWCVPMTGNRICWMLDEPLPEPRDCPEVENLSYNQQAVHDMCERYRAMQSPLEGVHLGELFDLTPAGTMLSLPREQASFSTWTHGKIALMGDACHKALPYGGQPMVQAGYDAAMLANVLYAHSLDPSHQDVEVRLRSYEAARRAEAKDAVESSRQFGHLLSRPGWIGKVVRYLVLNCIPQILLHSLGDRLNRNRPQASFLPKVI